MNDEVDADMERGMREMAKALHAEKRRADALHRRLEECESDLHRALSGLNIFSEWCSFEDKLRGQELLYRVKQRMRDAIANDDAMRQE